MHDELELLLQIQDLKAQRREISEGKARDIQEEEFNLDVDQAMEEIDSRIAEMEEKLSPGVRSRYRQLAQGRGRAVVPTIKGVCYGCFMAVHTSLASDSDRFTQIHTCDNCGRFLYFVN